MKKIPVTTVGLLVVLAACGDGDPAAPPAGAVSFSADVWQAGDGAAWHGYAAPAVEYDDESGALCATWTDEYLFTRDDGAYADTDFFSFEFSVQNGEEWDDLGDVNAKDSEGDRTGCYDLSGWEDGTYVFHVTGMAKHGTGPSTTTHHTDVAEIEVVIGAAWSVELIGGNQQDLDQQANSSKFTVGYQLFHGSTLVTDCDVVPSVGWAATVNQHNCDPTTGDRTLVLDNPSKGTPGAWTLTFYWDGSDPFAEYELTSSASGGGAGPTATNH